MNEEKVSVRKTYATSTNAFRKTYATYKTHLKPFCHIQKSITITTGMTFKCGKRIDLVSIHPNVNPFNPSIKKFRISEIKLSN
jgi:hypothetical protein